MNLIQDWPLIAEGPAPLDDLPAPRWKHNWSTHPESARRLFRLVCLLKPRLIVETGTFEALGTFALAKAAAQNGLPARIFTVDFDGDPLFDCPHEDWAALKTWRSENLQKARSAFPGVEIHFIEGDSREKLPDLLQAVGDPWDLFFQDSMHFTAGIQAEWEIMKPHASSQAVVVFDDVCLDWKKLPSHLLGRSDFCLSFVLGDALWGRWRWKSTAQGRAQFFAQRVG